MVRVLMVDKNPYRVVGPVGEETETPQLYRNPNKAPSAKL